MKHKIPAMTMSALLVAGVCAEVSADDQSTIDCNTASEDIAHLEHEKKSTDEHQFQQGGDIRLSEARLQIIRPVTAPVGFAERQQQLDSVCGCSQQVLLNRLTIGG